MKIKVLYFGIYRDISKCESEIIEAPAVTDTKQLLSIIKEKYPDIGKYPNLLISVNYKYCEDCCTLKDGDEVAIMAPVSGG